MDERDLRPSERKKLRVEKVAKLYAEGLKLLAISERLGIGQSTVSADLRAAGIVARKYEKRDFVNSAEDSLNAIP